MAKQARLDQEEEVLERLPGRDSFLPGQEMPVWPEVLLERLGETKGVAESTIIGPLPAIRWRDRQEKEA